MTTAQRTQVRDKELVRRRFYMKEDVWDYVENLSKELGVSPSIVVECILYERMVLDMRTYR